MTSRRAGIVTTLALVIVAAAGTAGCEGVSPTEPRQSVLPVEPRDTSGFIQPITIMPQ